MKRKTRPPQDRFWEKVNKDGPVPVGHQLVGPCWIWEGAKSDNGYGKFSPSKGDHRYAHRYAYELTRGLIDQSKCIDHLCRCRLCVNPDHLEAVTPRTNLMRGSGRTFQARVNGKCLRGHLLTKENSYVFFHKQKGKTVRRCRQCNMESHQRRRHADPNYGLLKKFCKNGHERTPENWVVKPNGKRTCRLCQEAWFKNYGSKPTNVKTLRELSDTDISTIRAMRSEGRKVKEIADHFSVTIATVQNIIFSRPWMKR